MSGAQIFYSSAAHWSDTSAPVADDLMNAEPSARAALAAASRIADDALFDELVALGIRADTIRALGLVPLAAVAWADGRLEEAERRALLAAARDAGLDTDGPGRRLLEVCLAASPPRSLWTLWRCWIGSASATLPANESRRWRDDIRRNRGAWQKPPEASRLCCRRFRFTRRRCWTRSATRSRVNPRHENSSRRADSVMAMTAGCFSRRSAEIA